MRLRAALLSATTVAALTAGTGPGAVPAPPLRLAQLPGSPIFGVDFGIHTAQGSNGTEPVPDSQIRSLLSVMVGKVVWVRTYNLNTDVPQIAHQMGFKVSATAFLTGSDSHNQLLIHTLETEVFNGWVDEAIVGSETLARPDPNNPSHPDPRYPATLTATQLIGYIRQVRSDIHGRVPVGTSDTDKAFLFPPNAGVMQASDVVLANIPPISYAYAYDVSMPYIKRTYLQLLAAGGGTHVQIGETEWPSQGFPYGPEPIAAAKYFDDVQRWARAAHVDVFYFEAFDEPYLGRANVWDAHWGIWQDDGTLKSGGFEAGFEPQASDGGYWLAASDGGIFPFGNAAGYGSTGGIPLNKPIVSMAATPDGKGYWLVGSDGGVFPFGDAGGYGSTGGIHLNQPIVGIASTPSGNGYWLVASDGGIFPFGDAQGLGSTGNIRLNQPIVGMATTSTGNGYWLVASDGGIFPFGDAVGYGSTGAIHLNEPVVGMATPDSGGYWLVASDGGIFPFGDAAGYGSTGGIHLNKPIVNIASTRTGSGYWLIASDGGIFPFGDAAGYGSTGSIQLNQPIITAGVS